MNLDELNDAHGTHFSAAGEYEGGEFGAQRLVDEHGAVYVLKLQPPGLAPVTTVALRKVGYPAPRYAIVAEEYSVQEELPGQPLGGWRVPMHPRLLDLNERQGGRAVDEDRSWPKVVVDSVITGGQEYMILANLLEHSPEGRELVELCARAAGQNAEVLETANDIVHWDFTAANVLAKGDEITGVIDWGGTCSGDRLFDLATFLFYAEASAPDLRAYIVERIGERGLSVYLAHMAIRQAEWSVRHHSEGAAWEMVRYGLKIARDFP